MSKTARRNEAVARAEVLLRRADELIENNLQWTGTAELTAVIAQAQAWLMFAEALS